MPQRSAMKPNIRTILSVLLVLALSASVALAGGCTAKNNDFTLLIYMCGSDLEIKNRTATNNIAGMRPMMVIFVDMNKE